MSADNKAILRQLYKKCGTSDGSNWSRSCFTKSCAARSNVTGSAVGRRRTSARLRVIAGFPDLRFTIEDMFCEREKLAVTWTIPERTKENSWGSRPPTGECPWKGLPSAICPTERYDSYVSWDGAGLLQQLGVAPTWSKPKVLRALIR